MVYSSNFGLKQKTFTHQLGGPSQRLRCGHLYLRPAGPRRWNHRSPLWVRWVGGTKGIDLTAGKHTALQRRSNHPLHPDPCLDATKEKLAFAPMAGPEGHHGATRHKALDLGVEDLYADVEVA